MSNKQTNKQTIIQAIKEMDIEKLEELLDVNRPYMDVPKALFLEKLKIQFDRCKKNKITSFDKLISGVCASCNKGCKGYSFITKDNQALDLFFEEENGEVTDVYLCNKLETEEKDTPIHQMYFSFYEDEKVTFKPSVDFLIKKQKIEDAIAEFEQFKDRFVFIEEIGYWKNKYKELIEEFDIPFFFVEKKYLVFQPFRDLCDNIRFVIDHLEKHKFAIQALSELEATESERELVYWLFTYEWSHLNEYSFERLDGWEQSGLITLKEYPSIIIDCSGYIESLQFSYLYNKHHEELIEKYNPTKEHFEKSNGGIEYSLESHLRIHEMYLDILPEKDQNL